jgi:hypothetical protein
MDETTMAVLADTARAQLFRIDRPNGRWTPLEVHSRRLSGAEQGLKIRPINCAHEYSHPRGDWARCHDCRLK